MPDKKNPLVGTTRKEMTADEIEWLKKFDQAFEHNDYDALEKITPNEELVEDVKRRQRGEHHARHRDIYTKQKAVHVNPSQGSYDESFDNFIEGDSSVEHYEEDETLNPKQIRTKYGDRYTPEDYCKPGIPNEDGLIDLIDAEREKIEAKKVKRFPRKPEVKGNAG